MHRTNTHRNDRILVIDDNPSIHEDIRKILGGRENKTKLLTAIKPCCLMTRFPNSSSPGSRLIQLTKARKVWTRCSRQAKRADPTPWPS